MRTLVIIPAYNEAASLPAVLARLRASRPDDDVVVVDDGSTDATAAVAREQGVVVLSLPFNLGIGGALRTGFRYAVLHGYDRAAQLDADGQHEPEALDVLFAGLDQGADLVIGSRFIDEGGYEVGGTRKRAMRMLQGLIRLLTRRRFTDTSSGFRAFSRPMLGHFATTYPSEYMESVEALLNAVYGGYRVVEVSVPMHQRTGGQASQQHLKLAYHYLRLVVTLLTHAGRRPPVDGAVA
ncbi:glycosyltransferase family 2 protein [Aquihabitans sp. McL0605]|uniref:glycosyltransferase family 2 protein n=1 Tax=Aquihabitans sp. McL0605 TaxID=3415671 RepID=UPI003CEF5E9E